MKAMTLEEFKGKFSLEGSVLHEHDDWDRIAEALAQREELLDELKWIDGCFGSDVHAHWIRIRKLIARCEAP